MRPLWHPTLINGRFGDPALYVEKLFEKRAILVDLGRIDSFAPRKIDRIEHVLVSHAHIDHFIGFDHLLRVLVGREKKIKMFGPLGFVDRVRHKLHGYNWNLVDRYACDLTLIVTEIDASLQARTVSFRLSNGFAGEAIASNSVADGVICSEADYRIVATVLDHRIPSLGFAIEESQHVNIWKEKLKKSGLPVGPWLHALKRAVVENKPDDYPIRVASLGEMERRQEMPLGALRGVLTVTNGQKIGYVTDVADTQANRDAIVRLVEGADILFIEAMFASDDAALAAERAHLTTTSAGRLARQAKVRRVEPFHFSTRYEGQEERMLSEVRRAFEEPA